MRMRLVGYSGERPPVPGTDPVEPVDPPPDPPEEPPSEIPDPLVLSLAHGSTFNKIDYLELGYNRFDVMCIGGAGGFGGGYRWSRGGDGSRNFYGGGGGGGGIHRIKGRLALLPTSCPVVVGAAGADAPFTVLTASGPDPHPGLADGGDGGYSSFNGVTCRASGGKGGKKPPPLTDPASPALHIGGAGGEGGVGNSSTPGGGAAAETDGTWNGTIGKGGGGGKGGTRTAYDNPFDSGDLWTFQGYEPDSIQAAAHNAHPGGKGAYSAAETTTSGPRGEVGNVGISWVKRRGNPPSVPWTYESIFGEYPIIAGPGGGATAFQLNGETLQYGSRAGGRPGTGAVIIRLTYAIV